MGTVSIDETDNKILRILIKDARTKLKDIAKECGMSSVSVLNRIKRLKNLGVITGSTLFPDLEATGFRIIAAVGIEADSNEDEILKFIGEHTALIEPSTSVGIYDISALVYTSSIAELDKAVNALKRQTGVRKITINVWSGAPHFAFENIDLQPRGI